MGTPAAGQPRVLQRPDELGCVLRAEDCQSAALDRSAVVDRPAQGIHQRRRFSPGPGRHHRLERRSGCAPRSRAGKPPHRLGQCSLRRLGEELHSRKVRPGLERLEERLERGVERRVPGERDVHRERPPRARGSARQRGEEAHRAGRTGRRGGDVEMPGGELVGPAAGERSAPGHPPRRRELGPGRREPLGGDLDQLRQMREPSSRRAHPLRGLGERPGRDAPQDELVEERLEGPEEPGGPRDAAEGAGAHSLDRRGEHSVQCGASAGPEPGRRHDRVPQPLQRPALLARASHGGPATLRPADDTGPQGDACPTAGQGTPRRGSSRRAAVSARETLRSAAARRTRRRSSSPGPTRNGPSPRTPRPGIQQPRRRRAPRPSAAGPPRPHHG